MGAYREMTPQEKKIMEIVNSISEPGEWCDDIYGACCGKYDEAYELGVDYGETVGEWNIAQAIKEIMFPKEAS